jgi:uncharacterized tellurite resistance protein B-like protein
MSRMRQSFFCLAAATVVFTASAQTPTPVSVKNFPAATNLLPIVPVVQSPVNFFRQLLAMSPAERNNSLTNRTPEARTRILAKVREYQSLSPDERELRLRATELRWYLMPLLRAPAAEREAGLAQVPEDFRALAKTRLAQWNLLPPPLQQEFLANDKVLHSFAHVETANAPVASPEQQKIAEQFKQFFELTPAEKQQTLATLSEAERAQMQTTLQSFAQLPPQQRRQCVLNYAKFAGMSGTERAEFLKNAESWSRMSSKERQTWRDLVAHVPMWPPAPAIVPQNLIPHATPKIPRTSVATNH